GSIGVAVGGAVAFGAGEGGGGDFQVVTEDLVVADFERLDAGPLPLRPFETGDPVAGFAGPLAVAVELGGVAGAEGGAFADQGGRVVRDCRSGGVVDLLALGDRWSAGRPGGGCGDGGEG